MDRQYDFAALEALLKKRSFKALREALLELNEVDIAEFLGLLNGEEAVLAFRTLPKGVAADVFAELEPEMQQLIVAAATDAELAVIVEDLYVDDAVDMLEDMPANVVKRILKNATPEMRGLINQFLKYPEHSAGSIMTAEFTDLRPTMTVEQAIRRIRRIGIDKETIDICYVLDSGRKLIGTVQAAGRGDGAQPAAGAGQPARQRCDGGRRHLRRHRDGPGGGRAAAAAVRLPVVARGRRGRTFGGHRYRG